MINGISTQDAAASRNRPSGLTRKHATKNDVIEIDKAFIMDSSVSESLDYYLS